MKQRQTPIVAALLTVLVACAPGVVPPAAPPAPTEHYVRAPFDTVWQRVVGFFADSRVPIRTIDKSSGIIASSGFELPFDLAQKWADCGKTSSGQTALDRLQEIHNIPSISADFNVFVRPAGDSTGVRVNVGMSGTADSPGGRVALRCVTNGEFEKALVAQVSR